MLTIKVNGETTYKESVYVGVGANTVVDTNAFVGLKNKSNIVDYGAKQVEENVLKKPHVAILVSERWQAVPVLVSAKVSSIWACWIPNHWLGAKRW